ncbi:hypothetical protein GCM10028799_76850 [Kribbella italica]
MARLRDEWFATADDRVALQIALDLYNSALPERPAWSEPEAAGSPSEGSCCKSQSASRIEASLKQAVV